MRRGALFLLAWAGFMAWLAITGDPGLEVPAYIAWVIAITLLAASLALFAKAAGRTRLVMSLVVTILALMTLTGAWIGVGPGARSCRSGIDDMPSREASGTTCRMVFGFGSLITAGMTWVAIRQLRRARHATSTEPPR